MHFPVAHSGQNRRKTLLLRNFHLIFVNKKFSGEADDVDGLGVENVCEVEISVNLIAVCFLNRKKRQQMIKRRTKRQQQKGRKEPKAKMKLNKRMLKKKTTLKTEIPKLMRYFSYSKHENEHRCIDKTSAGDKDWASRGVCAGQLPGSVRKNSILLWNHSCCTPEPFHRWSVLSWCPSRGWHKCDAEYLGNNRAQ